MVNNLKKSEDEPNWGKIVLEYLTHWKTIAITTVSFIILAIFIIFVTEKQYNLTSSILLNENKSSNESAATAGMSGLADLGLMSTTNNVDNEVAIFNSPDLMREVVDTLNIGTKYLIKSGLRIVDIYKDCPYTVLRKPGACDFEGNTIKLVISKQDQGISVNGALTQVNGSVTKFAKEINTLPATIDLPNKLGQLVFSQNTQTENPVQSKKYIIEIEGSDKTASELDKQLSVKATTVGASVLDMNLVCPNVQEGKDVLNMLVKEYNEENIIANNETAKNTAKFIDSRLSVIEAELSGIENNLANFKQQEGIASLEAQSKLYIEQTGANEGAINSSEVQAQIVGLVADFINNPANEYKLIPNTGIPDPILERSILDYNAALLQYQKMSSRLSDDSPTQKQTLESLKRIRANIFNSMQNLETTLKIRDNNIASQNVKNDSKIHAVPVQEKDLQEKERQQSIKQSLYLFLLQKREATNISMASTSDKAKIITSPRYDKKVSPKGSLIMAILFILGVALGVGIVYIQNLFKVSISNREELERLASIPVIGQIPNNATHENIVVRENQNTPIIELFRALRNNIGFMLNSNKKIILTTSTTSGEGKTFVSINTALSFALNKKKVLLVGLDIRNPQLANALDLKQKTGITSYLSADVADWHELLVPCAINPNLDILHGGIIPPNPNELLMSSALEKFIEEAKLEYDVIILDSAPVGVISDTFLLNKFADLILYVVRENVTRKDSIEFINAQTEDGRLENVYLVLNDVQKKNGSYKYGYGKTYGYEKK